MTDLLILADDLTGALDTGVKFSQQGAATEVWLDSSSAGQIRYAASVTVINTNSRHLQPQDAAAVISKITGQALQSGVRQFYKKTDSALRGNVGAELGALQQTAGGSTLFFAPAYPALGRTTKDGIHYVHGVPVSNTAFGRDPFDPVATSDVAELLGRQGLANVVKIPVGAELSTGTPNGSVLVFDAETDKDLSQIAAQISGDPLLMAGCGGFAAAIFDYCNLVGEQMLIPELPHRAIVISGSIHPVTLAQTRNLQQNGYPASMWSPAKLEAPGFARSRAGQDALGEALDLFSKTGMLYCGVSNHPEDDLRGQVTEAARQTVSENIGILGSELLRQTPDAVFIVIGGDTLLSILHQAGCGSLTPICEPITGCVLCAADLDGQKRYLITKSGGFGREDTLSLLLEGIAHESF